MGTRANIARKNLDGSFDVIYTHWDGYPDHHGPILLENYSSDEMVAKLMELGDLSTLGEKIGERHSFDDSGHSDWCRVYGRDRGESGVSAKHFATVDELAAYLKESWTEWVYIWDVGTQEWTYTNNPSPTWFKCCGRDQKPERKLKNWDRVVA